MAGNQNSQSENQQSRIHAIVEGRVQGVGFRAYTQRQTEFHNLTGWVRNRWNGTVEVIAEGQRDNLNKFIKTIERGPFSGTTRKVVVEWGMPSGEFSYFNIRMTG